MTPAEIKKTRLYRTLAPCVRKEGREELARMLAMVPDSAVPSGESGYGWDSPYLSAAFSWMRSPQGFDYWMKLSNRLARAGHECW